MPDTGQRQPVTGPVLSRGTVDRDGQTREDDAALQRAWDQSAVLVLDPHGRAAIADDRLVLLDPASAPDGERYYLGRDEERSYFAVAAPSIATSGAPVLGLREVGALLTDRDAGLLVHAVGLQHWHRLHRYCTRCGAPTHSARGGHLRRCAENGCEHFPRTDPAIIVLVTDGADRAVLGRQHVWPTGRFSTLAGFVEPGESLEQAVVREVQEEASVVVRDVTYRGSQPWPFPASLMLGFRALADPAARPTPGDAELAEVRWFTRQQLHEAGGWDSDAPASLRLPPAVSIAHRLITDWLGES